MDWHPIETAPKDRRIMLYRPTVQGWGKMVFGRFDDDRYARKPRPYWSHDLERLEGKTEAREHQPTHWADPEPPTALLGIELPARGGER